MRDLAARSRALACDAKRYEQQLSALIRSEARAYLDRRISEGKTKCEVMRALKRHISDLFKQFAGVPLTC